MIDQPLGYATAGTSKANERPPEGKIAPELKRLQVQNRLARPVFSNTMQFQDSARAPNRGDPIESLGKHQGISDTRQQPRRLAALEIHDRRTLSYARARRRRRPQCEIGFKVSC